MNCDYYKITQLVVDYKDGKTEFVDIQREPCCFKDNNSNNNDCSNTIEDSLVIFDNCEWVTTDINVENKQKYYPTLVLFKKNISNIQKITKIQFNVYKIV